MKKIVLFVLFAVTCPLFLSADTSSTWIENQPLRIGILCAHPKEIGGLVQRMEGPIETETRGMRTYQKGRLFGNDVVIACSRLGKAASAATAAHLIVKYQVDCILFTGAAGAADPSLAIGDVVVGTAFVQHDLDSQPIIPRFHIPLLGIRDIYADPILMSYAGQSAETFVEKELKKVLSKELLDQMQVENPKVRRGLIASGDQFIANKAEIEQLKRDLPAVLCIDMEGAAVAQVCYEYGVPFCSVRVISDVADDQAHVDCFAFMNKVLDSYTIGITRGILEQFPHPVDEETKKPLVRLIQEETNLFSQEEIALFP